MGKERLFGTDGIRGVAGRYPLDPPTIRAVVLALLDVCQLGRSAGERFLVARDTRVSGPWIRDVIRAALADRDLLVEDAGVLPTPAAARFIPDLGCAGGVVISASHNPAADNGLKFLSAEGIKLSDETEAAIERLVAAAVPEADRPAAEPPGEVAASTAAEAAAGAAGWRDRYLEYLLRDRPFDGAPAGFRVVIDGAQGAASPILPELARRVPFRVIPVCVRPNGRNINRDCGATAPDRLLREVAASGAALGLALDGDGDRLVACDSRGRILDGDALLYVFARHLDGAGRLAGRTVVGTVMTNMGLEAALARAGIRLRRTPVGDRHIQECLLREGLTLGGEPSGHLILRPPSITGDGLLAGLFLLEILFETGRTPEELLAGFHPFPSRVINLPARRRLELEGLRPLGDLLGLVAGEPSASARAVVRYSGTEPLLRIMLEAERLDDLLGRAAPLIEEIRRLLDS